MGTMDLGLAALVEDDGRGGAALAAAGMVLASAVAVARTQLMRHGMLGEGRDPYWVDEVRVLIDGRSTDFYEGAELPAAPFEYLFRGEMTDMEGRPTGGNCGVEVVDVTGPTARHVLDATKQRLTELGEYVMVHANDQMTWVRNDIARIDAELERIGPPGRGIRCR